jgi:hypothetical protein
MVIWFSSQSRLASVTSSRIASMIFFKRDPCSILASNIFLSNFAVRFLLVDLREYCRTTPGKIAQRRLAYELDCLQVETPGSHRAPCCIMHHSHLSPRALSTHTHHAAHTPRFQLFEFQNMSRNVWQCIFSTYMFDVLTGTQQSYYE